MRYRIGLASTLLVLSVAVPVWADDQGTFVPGTAITTDSVVKTMNYYRAVAGLVPLEVDQRLTLAAQDRMRDMAETGYFAHEAPNGRPPFIWVRARHFDYTNAAENLARGFETAQILVASWMESEGHRRNILDGNFDRVGIAIMDGSPLGRESGKSVVVLFARERRSVAEVQTERP